MKGFAFTTFLVISAFAFSSVAAERMVIDNFSDGDRRTEQGGWWYVYNDARLGGNSECSPAPNKFMPTKGTDNQGFAGRLTGLTGTKLGWDYIGMGFTLTAESGCPTSKSVDISPYNTLEFKMKGSASAGRLTVTIIYTEDRCDENNVPHTKTAWADYQVAVTSDLSGEWATVKLDLRTDFAQPSWTKAEHVVSIEEVLSHAHTINWQFSSADGDTLDLWIDDVSLY
jgi:hypothetical protein